VNGSLRAASFDFIKFRKRPRFTAPVAGGRRIAGGTRRAVAIFPLFAMFT